MGYPAGRRLETRDRLHLRFACVHSLPEPAYGADAKTTFGLLSLRSNVAVMDDSGITRYVPSRLREDGRRYSADARG